MRRAFLWGSNANEHYSLLRYAKADARALGSVLSEPRYGFHVEVHERTNDPYEVHRVLREASVRCKADDLFIAHFSGHGQIAGRRLYLALDESLPAWWQGWAAASRSAGVA